MKTVSLNVLWNVILVYCVLFVSFSELQQIGGFLRVMSGTPVSSTNKIDIMMRVFWLASCMARIPSWKLSNSSQILYKGFCWPNIYEMFILITLIK
jgi:hypothetical protein